MRSRHEPLLDRSSGRRIIDDAVRLLGDVGVGCEHARTARELAERAPGVACRRGRLLFERDTLRAHIARRRAGHQELAPLEPGAEGAEPPFALVAPWCSFLYCDPLTGEVRTPTETEVIDAARFIDALTIGTGPFGGAIPMYPPGVPPRLATLHAERIALLHTARLGGKLTALDAEEIAFFTAMYKAAGRRYRLALQGMISPLRLNPEIMETFFRQDGNPDIDLEISCPIPMLGSTAPASLPAALVQACAEAIAGDFIFNTLSARGFDALVVRLEPFDMRSGNIVFGSPEWCVFNKAAVDLESELRGRPRRYGAFRTNARRVDAQCLIERSSSGLMQALNGVRAFGAVGQLCVDEVWSPLQAALDRQILLYMKRVVRGFDGCWEPAADTAALVREGLQRGSFLDAESTVAGFRGIYDFEHAFTYGNVASWKAGGMKGLEDAAREEIAATLAGYSAGATGSRAAEVESIFQDAKRFLSRAGT